MRGLLAGLILLLQALAGSGAALAHANLLRSEPADGALLRESPARYELIFDEPVSPLVLLLVGPAGDTTVLERARGEDTRLTIDLPAGLVRGTHIMSWRVISADGHPVGGSLVFSIGQVSSGAQSAGQAGLVLTPASGPIWLTRLLLFAGLLIGVGGSFFHSWLAPPGTLPAWAARSISLALAVGAAAAALSIGLQGLDAHARPLSEIAVAAMWSTGLNTTYAITALLALGALGAAALALRIEDGAVGRALSMAAILGAGLALAASGHASSAEPQLLMRPAMVLHGTTIAVWAGALLPLAAVLSRPAASSTAALGRFSAIAVALFILIVASGLALAIVEAGSVAALWSTDYGLLLSAKLLAIAAVLGLAGWNRWRLTPAALGGESAAQARLAHLILIELALAGLILALVAGWRFTPTPRALSLRPEPQFQIHMHGTRAMANLVMTPARAGPVRITIAPKTPDLRALRVREVALTLASEEADIEPIRREARAGDAETWTIGDLTIAPGRWRVGVDLLVSDFERVRLDARIDVRR